MPRRDDDPPLFVKNDVPVKFCFHKSVRQGRSQIIRDVEKRGGKFVHDERDTNVLLVDEEQDLDLIRRQYYNSSQVYRLSIYVEPRGFVQACIRSGNYCHIAPTKRGMPGRARVQGAAPRMRVPFTEDDRDRLAGYIATLLPTRDGRMGNAVYQQLVFLGQTDDEEWGWVRRHTWHSWREQYKKNSDAMDARIAVHIERIKNVGHHFGEDPRRHDFRNLRQEEEAEQEVEGEQEEQEEEQEAQQRGVERQDRERRVQVRPTVVTRQPDQAAQNYLARHERDLMRFDEQAGDGSEEEAEVAIQELQRIKRLRAPPEGRHPRETQAKKARASRASSIESRSSDVEIVERSPERPEEGGNNDESQEIEGDDLFGDRSYEESRFNYNDLQDIDQPMPFFSRTSPGPEQDGPPLSTQATLIGSPRSAEKAAAPVPAHTPTKVPQTEAPTLSPAAPSSSQQTMVVTQVRVAAPRARVRGASAQPGSSIPRETRARGGAAATGAVYRNTRARSRSVEPQPQPSQLPPLEIDQRDIGKGKEVLPLIEEDMGIEEGPEEEHVDDDVLPRSVAGGMSTRSTVEDENAVEELLEASTEDNVDQGEDRDRDEDEDEDEDEGSMPQLPRFQDVDIGGDPSDSDDAEVHESLVRDAVQEGATGEDEGGDEHEHKHKGDAPEGAESGSDDQDQEDDDQDKDRITRMARGSLRAKPALAPLQLRITRSMVARQQIDPRRTRSGNLASAAPLAGFPSPGTKARAVVNRFQEEVRQMAYVPPQGTRAAKAARGRGRRG